MSQMPASVVLSNKKLASRRFVFDTFKIRELKSKVISAFEDKQEFNYNPSRVEVVAAFLWKCALKAFISRKRTFRPSIFIQAVNLRPRMDPSLPQNAMGNLAWLFPLVVIENEKDLEFVELVKELMATRLSLKNKVKEFKGAGIVEALKESLKEREELLSNKMDYAVYICASWCRCPLFETDFGWGKPAWIISVVNHLMTNTIHLLDTKDVDGVEALVHLDEEEMNIFENIEDLLKFTSTNPSVSVI
ncbi:vinorine synthase-like [Quillaja saponaria]|uniref:Vinorine synthase-like n=1 Tax=Quillaja saponaria TaxID=32244 RepID=A0AAD7LUX0_QUISA|nr:vinorine synthase-like [Quillaja saponaria]